MRGIFFVILFFFVLNDCILAQGAYLSELKTNPVLVPNSKKNTQRETFEMNYIIDTLHLPFIDDFSHNFQLRYRDYNPGNQFVIDSAQSVYRFGNEVMDTIKYTKFATHSYYYSSIVNKVDTVKNDSLIIEIFTDSISDFVKYDYGWKPEDYYYKNGELTHIQELDFDSILKDSVWYKYYVNDTSKHWLDNGVWINSTMAINPPTIGVATFDGVDSIGHPYNFSSEGAYGVADYLTSYPLNLKNKNNVKLSFYYQPQGLGNAPESKDSLVLEFYGNNKWNYAWSSQGKELQDFEYVQVPITDSIYLYKGFQFRFKNYATLSGSLDHWHIDYVYLDENRTGSNTALNDFAFKKVERSFINNYSSMPYKHYIVDPATYMKNDVDITLHNMSLLDLSGSTNYSIIDWNTNTTIFDSENSLFISFPKQSENTYNHSVMADNNQFEFPNTGAKTNTFKINYISNSNTIQASEINKYNDNVIVEQVFDTYYAYDDGSPESGFAVAGDGAFVALKYELAVSDTITGILINFLEMFENVDNRYKIKVWSDLGGIPGEKLYESDFNDVPKYITESEIRTPLTFTRLELDSLLILPAGTYYIGWVQERLSKFFVGYDKNNDATDKLLYNVGLGWQTFSERGALLMRPEFGKSTIKSIISTKINEINAGDIQVFPNPANNFITIYSPSMQQLTASVYDAFGKLIENYKLDSGDQIDVSFLANGMYILVVQDDANYISTNKIMIQHE